MRKGWWLLILSGMIFGGCSPINRRAGVEIICYPTAKVIIEGKEVGTTPYKNSHLMPGETNIELVAGEKRWEKKVSLVNNVSTVIDWEIGESEEKSGGYILSMERTGDKGRAGVLINAFPNKTAVAVGGEIRGYSPIRIDDIGTGEKQITLSYPTYKSLNVFVKAIGGYRLLIEAKLPREEVVVTGQVVEEERAERVIEKKSVMIKATETGWLRVREEPLTDSKEVGRVKPGEKYEILEEKVDWFRIMPGWISAKYAEKL